jgi:mono/diheme cytochrome c family protein
VLTGVSGDTYLDRIPVEVDAALLDRGQNRFAVYCATCHGLLGDGHSKVAENMARRPAPSLHEAPINTFPVGRLYRIVREGYGLMPAYGSALDVRERWAVVAYVEVLKLSQRAAVSQLPARVLEEAKPWLK